MEIVRGYFDYNIDCFTGNNFNSKQFIKIAKNLLEYGYRTIAINQTIDADTFITQKKKKKGSLKNFSESELIPDPIKVDNIEGLKILNRLTIMFSNQDDVFKLGKLKNYQLFDIIAVLPKSKNAFQHACTSLDFDIFCFNSLNSRQVYKLTRKSYNQLVEKGVHFEICYAPAIVDNTQRKNIIQTAHFYHSFGKSKNIIISSGATSPFTIRSPYDIVNLSHLFGLNEEKAKKSILSNGRNVFIHAVRRKIGKTLLFLEHPKIDIKSENIAIKEESDDFDEDMDVEQPAQKKTKV